MTALRFLVALLLASFLGLAAAGGNDVPSGDLPPEARVTLHLIATRGLFPHKRDGVVFANREQRLPLHSWAYYHEYTVPTPGAKDRGARRVITGERGERYYTEDHYGSFRRIRE